MRKLEQRNHGRDGAAIDDILLDSPTLRLLVS